MEEWKKRLKQARLAKNLNKTTFAKAVGVSNPTVTDWEKSVDSGGIKEINGLNLMRACDVLGITPQWLLSNTGPMRTDSQELSIAATTTIPNPNTSSSTEIEIPQYIKVGGSMGNGVLLRDQPGEIHGWRVTPEWLLKNVPSNTGVENLAIVTGFGPSMRGMFNPGDPLLVDRGVKKVEHDAVYFFRVGDEGFIKTLQRVPGVGLRAISKNKEFETWTITPDMDFEVLAKVLKVWQSEDF